MSDVLHARDRLSSIFSAILPTMVVAIPITMQPAIVQGMVEFMGVDEVHAGYVTGAEIMGLMIGTVIFAFIANMFNWKRVLGFALVLTILANILTAVFGNGGNLLPLRAAAGLGAGLITAVGFASLANTLKPGRNYGWLIACVIGFSAIGFELIGYIYGLGGYLAFIWVYAGLTICSLLALRFLTSDHDEKLPAESDGQQSSLFAGLNLLALISVLLFFIAYMSAWTYLSFIGQGSGLDEGQVNRVFAISQAFGVAGALSISMLGERVNHKLLAVLIFGAGIVGIYLFRSQSNYATFFALNAIFQFCWNAGQPLLLTIIASRQSTGKLLRFAIPLQFIGMAIGPIVAAFVLDMTDSYLTVLIVSVVAAVVSLLAILPFTTKHLQNLKG